MGRSPCCDKSGLKKGPWTSEEDQKLIDYIEKHGYSNWRTLPKNAGLQRCGKSCRLRWINYLRPDIKRGNFSFQEEEIIIQLHSILGNKWSAIASRLPGRTDNEIKNHWNTHIKKRLLRLGIDPVTHDPGLGLIDLSSIWNHGSLYSSIPQVPINPRSSLFDDQSQTIDPMLLGHGTSLVSSQGEIANINLDSNLNSNFLCTFLSHQDQGGLESSSRFQNQLPISENNAFPTTLSTPCVEFSSSSAFQFNDLQGSEFAASSLSWENHLPMQNYNYDTLDHQVTLEPNNYYQSTSFGHPMLSTPSSNSCSSTMSSISPYVSTEEGREISCDSNDLQFDRLQEILDVYEPM